MNPLNPAPSSLGLFSPALGAWFQTSDANDADLAALQAPSADLSVSVTLNADAIWNAPAGGTLTYAIATTNRPPVLSTLRSASGTPAFDDNTLVLLFRLLPEIAERLGALSQAVARPDATTASTGDQRTRPVITSFALEVPGISSMTDLQAILPSLGSADLQGVAGGLDDDAQRATYLGLSASGGLSNGTRPATILRRPEKDDRRLFENGSGAPINAKLWAFTRNGRAYDPGTVAAIWTQLAGTDWTNLWASDSARQRTAAVAPGRTVLFVNAHQGPLEDHIKSRMTGQLTDLTAVGTSDVLFTAGSSPAVALSAAGDADTDTAPLPRIAPLPAGPYAALSSATPFAGWDDAGALARDFQRVAILDVERHLVGLARDSGSAQADPRRRVTAAQNTADPLFLADADAVATEVMARFAAASATVDFIAPELDRDYGPQPRATLGGDDPFDNAFDDPDASAHTLKGSGQAAGDTASDQSIVLRFDGTLPNGAWIRAWPHGRDTTTGRRFRMTGGAALSDGSGSALLILPLPDGEAGGGANPPPFSYDLSITTAQGSRLFTDRRADRPAVDASVSPVDIAALGGGQTLYCCETAGQPAPSTGALAPGQSVIVLTGAVTAEDFTALDMASLRAVDLSASLPNRADGDDRIITNDPAFVETTEGDLPPTQQAGGPERVHEGGFHTGATAQEIYDFAAFDTTGNQGVIGAVAGRRIWHEAPPSALGHPGVNAAPEIHGDGLGVAGPAADQLRLLMRERRPGSVVDFIEEMGRPFTSATAPTDAGPWTAILETAAKGTHGDLLISLIPDTVNPGEIWDNSDPANPGIKQRIDAVLATLPGGLDVDTIIGAIPGFDDTLAAAAFDRLLDKSRKGAQGFARAALSAITRAEDLIWLQTPALDGETWTSTDGNIEILQALTSRLSANPALRLVLVLPEKHLPKRLPRLDEVRKDALQGALMTLNSAAEDRIVWVTPIGGPGRAMHSASTNLIVDDAVLYTGAAHTWRRGLVFDSSLTGAVFDERLSFGRPQAVINARRQLAGALLGVDADTVPHTGPELVAALKAQKTGGGFARANPAAYTPKADPTTGPDKEVWNPSPDASRDWQAFISTLAGNLGTDFQNGTR